MVKEYIKQPDELRMWKKYRKNPRNANYIQVRISVVAARKYQFPFWTLIYHIKLFFR